MDGKADVLVEANGKEGVETPMQTEHAITAVLTHPTLHSAAEALGLSRMTLWRIMKRPEFQEQYREARRQIVSHAISQVQQSTVQALKTLREVMEDSQAFATARVLAAKIVLSVAVKGVEMEDVEARLSALEADIREEKARQRARQ